MKTNVLRIAAVAAVTIAAAQLHAAVPTKTYVGVEQLAKNEKYAATLLAMESDNSVKNTPAFGDRDAAPGAFARFFADERKLRSPSEFVVKKEVQRVVDLIESMKAGSIQLPPIYLEYETGILAYDFKRHGFPLSWTISGPNNVLDGLIVVLPVPTVLRTNEAEGRVTPGVFKNDTSAYESLPVVGDSGRAHAVRVTLVPRVAGKTDLPGYLAIGEDAAEKLLDTLKPTDADRLSMLDAARATAVNPIVIVRVYGEIAPLTGPDGYAAIAINIRRVEFFNPRDKTKAIVGFDVVNNQ